MTTEYSESSEDSAMYKPGGYHPVGLGEIYYERFLVIKKLGYGHFSTVWLCYDLESYSYLAMKVMRSKEHYTAAGEDEIEFLELADKHKDHPGYQRIIKMHGYFYHDGPNGRHLCLLFEVLGCSLVGLLRSYDYSGLPLKMIQGISRQVLEGLEFLHDVCNIIHTDIKPDNILICYSAEEYNNYIIDAVLEFKGMLSSPTDIKFYDSYGELIFTAQEQRVEDNKQKKRDKKKRYRQRKKAKKGVASQDEIEKLSTQPEQKNGLSREQKCLERAMSRRMKRYDNDIQVKIADIANGCYTYKLYTDHIQTRQYRSPEVILGITYNATADVWSFACTVFELLTGDLMFKPKETDRYSKEDDHLKLIIETVSSLPLEWKSIGKKYKEYFNKKGELRRRTVKPRKLFDVLCEKYRILPEVSAQLSSFLMPMLEVRPETRISAKNSLQHSWLSQDLSPDIYMSEADFEEYEKSKQDRSYTPDSSLELDADVEDNSLGSSVESSSYTSSDYESVLYVRLDQPPK